MAFHSMLILFVTAALSSAYAATLDKLPICIVGAGPTGLTVAHGLEAKGYKTVVFDRQREVGGKCQAYYDGPNKSTYHPLGALIFINGTYVNTVPLIDAAGVALTPGISRLHGWEYWQYGPQDPSKDVTKLPDTTSQQAALLQSEYERYTQFWTENIQPLYTTVRYVNGIPEDLTVPIADWLSANGYIGLPTIMEGAMITYGYGDIKTTPAIYMLQYFTPEILGAFSLGNPQSYIVDFHAVFVHYARSVKGPVRVNAPVTKIDRSGTNPVVTYTSAGHEKTEQCSDVVLAFSPSPENLGAIDMPLTANESDVFSRVDTTAYWSSAVTTKIDYHKFYRQSPAEPLGAPVGFLRYFNESPIATGYSWATDRSTLPDSDVKTLLVDTITQVQAGVNISEPLVTENDVKALDRWTDYFPRFNTSDLSSGIYAKYNALQGQNHTYYASAVSSFELVENAIRVGQDLVASFF